MNSKDIHRFKVLSTTISFILICSALLSVASTPAKGYELSIYSATPRIFWIAIIYGLFNGFILIASCLYDRSKMWMIGLFEIIFCNCLVISLYALRGYICLRWDPLSLVGLAKDICSYGLFDKNIYPISSILIATLSQVMGVPVFLISNYLPSLFFVIYMLSIFCWSKSLIYDRKFVLCSTMASVPIFFAWFTTSIYPMILSALTIPFFLYCLQRNIDYRFRIFTIIYCIIYPFFHPITAVMIFLYLSTIFICERVWSRVDEKRNQISITLITVSFITVVSWFTWQYILLKRLNLVIFQFFGILETQTTLVEAQNYLYNLGITAALRPLFFMLSDEIVFSLITLVAFLLILRDERFKEKLIPVAMCFIIGVMFITAFSIYSHLHSSKRIINLNINMVLTPPLVGYLTYRYILNKERIKTYFMFGLIIFSVIISIVSLYRSPITMLANNQVTISEVKGMNWLIIQKNPKLKTMDIQSPVYRYADFIYGCNFRMGRRDLYRYLELPNHFGFTDKNIFPIDEDRYLVITEFELKGYTKLWKDLDKFVKEDFIKVDFCTNVDKIYENGELRNYFVHKDD